MTNLDREKYTIAVRYAKDTSGAKHRKNLQKGARQIRDPVEDKFWFDVEVWSVNNFAMYISIVLDLQKL